MTDHSATSRGDAPVASTQSETQSDNQARASAPRPRVDLSSVSRPKLAASPAVARKLRACASYGTACDVAPGVQVILANNAKDYTGPGTNTYLVGGERLWVIDPGPAKDCHTKAVLAAIAGRPVDGILVTHTHLDHSPAARPLAEATGAPVISGAALSKDIIDATGEEVDPGYRPDRVLTDGDTLDAGDIALTAVHTPGHFPNHFAYWAKELGIVFSGDHIMGWSTTVVVPPLGDLKDYLTSVDRLAALKPALMLPSHGPAIEDPAARVADIMAHRACRQQQIEACVAAGIDTPQAIVAEIYDGLTPTLQQAAQGQVQAHLQLDSDSVEALLKHAEPVGDRDRRTA